MTVRGPLSVIKMGSLSKGIEGNWYSVDGMEEGATVSYLIILSHHSPSFQLALQKMCAIRSNARSFRKFSRWPSLRVNLHAEPRSVDCPKCFLIFMSDIYPLVKLQSACRLHIVWKRYASCLQMHCTASIGHVRRLVTNHFLLVVFLYSVHSISYFFLSFSWSFSLQLQQFTTTNYSDSLHVDPHW